MPSLIIPFPTEFRPQLPTIVGNVDYKILRQTTEQIDELLRVSIEREFVELALGEWLSGDGPSPSADQRLGFQLNSRRALRCNVLRTLLQEDFRGFSVALANSPLYQRFCLIDALDVVKVPSKSQLQRYAVWVDKNAMRKIMDQLLQGALEQPEKLGLNVALDLEEYFLDTTCLKANIHFPVDWVLLRDAARTLMKAVKLIRREGLKGRMEAPEEFLRRMNALCIQMTHQRRQKESKKGRKKVLRQMEEKRFSGLQKRRSQTEGRIGILKAGFFGRPMRAKGFENRELALAWGVLTHNLWKLASMRKKEGGKEKRPPLRQAA